MAYTVTPTRLAEVLILQPQVFGDARGFFYESFNARDFASATGLQVEFVQDNHSMSSQGVLRGLHYQLEPMSQGKLVRVVHGEIFDVAVDMRRSSPTFGQWVGVELSAENKRQLWVPPGFAHGFYVTSQSAELIYKCTDYYDASDDQSLLWNDDTVGIDWPLVGAAPLLSAKDEAGKRFEDAATYA